MSKLSQASKKTIEKSVTIINNTTMYDAYREMQQSATSSAPEADSGFNSGEDMTESGPAEAIEYEPHMAL